MSNFAIKDFGIACLIFWWIIGLCLVWYACKTEEPGCKKHRQEDQEAKISLPENSQEEEIHDTQNETTLNVLKLPTDQ
ncbi:MAG: hypothetical protein K0R52_774 [Alphaproteobacteria bacterium]|jgi:hypothetical protein|nr:hypothetical protein [Alphaproteobacteria bacterium]